MWIHSVRGRSTGSKAVERCHHGPPDDYWIVDLSWAISLEYCRRWLDIIEFVNHRGFSYKQIDSLEVFCLTMLPISMNHYQSTIRLRLSVACELSASYAVCLYTTALTTRLVGLVKTN